MIFTLNHLLTWISSLFAAHGAHHTSILAVSHHLGWVESKHWLITVCRIGTKGCHF